MPTAKYQGKELKEGEEIVVRISFDNKVKEIVEVPTPEPVPDIVEPEPITESVPSSPHFIDANKFVIEEPQPVEELTQILDTEPITDPVPESEPNSVSPEVYSANDFLEKASTGDIDLIPTEKAETPHDLPPEEAFPPGVDNEVVEEEISLPEYHHADHINNDEDVIPVTPEVIVAAAKTRPNIFVMGCLMFLFLSFTVLLIVAGVMLFSLL